MTVPWRRQLFWAGMLFAAAGLARCGGDGAVPTTPEPPEPPAALDVPFGFTDLEEGDGARVESGWLLAIAFTAWLYDPAAADHRGLEIGSSPAGGASHFRLGIGQVIPGLDEGLAGMRVGGARRIVIPPDRGYGAQGTGLVPGNATLLYEVELVAGAAVVFETTDLREGDGEEAINGASLSMAYHGWVFDLLAEDNKGHTFDSTTADAPFTFTLGIGEVIAGWDLGVPGMKVGGRRRLVVPHDLAYRDQRLPGIPAYATLLFEVELLAIE